MNTHTSRRAQIWLIFLRTAFVAAFLLAAINCFQSNMHLLLKGVVIFALGICISSFGRDHVSK